MKTRTLLFGLLALVAAPMVAQEADAPLDWPEAVLSGTLGATDPTFRRPAFDGLNNCILDPMATAVRYDVHEIVLPGQAPATPGHLRASLCDGGTAAFNAVLLVYARNPGQPAVFNPQNPCLGLIWMSDDACGQQPLLNVESSMFTGTIELVVTSDLNGGSGAYSVELLSLTSNLGQFMFRESTEWGSAGQWELVEE